jgi:hypothetical protein
LKNAISTLILPLAASAIPTVAAGVPFPDDLLLTSLVSGTGGFFAAVILAPALADGVAGSLCWRGKLPGTR